jgi:phosphoglycolate phosphatase
MRAFAAVIFDYDGTLFDTRPAIVHCIAHALRECGRPLPAHETIARTVNAGLPLPDTFLTLDGRLRRDRTSLNELVRCYRKLYADEAAPLLRPFAGVKQALQRLHEGGAKCLIVSNKGIAAIHRSLEQNQLTLFLDMVFADQPSLPKKPDPAILVEHILPRYAHLAAEQILMVGDTEIDILFAKRTGMSSCWASYGYGDPERCRKLGPDHQIAKIDELPALVLSQ